MKLTTPLIEVNLFAKKLSSKLKKLGLITIQDLLFYLPYRYEDYSKVVSIQDLVVGEQFTIKARVAAIAARRGWKYGKMFTEAVVEDETGKIKLMWFGQPFIAKILKVGDLVYFSGVIKDGKLGLNMVNPMFEKESREKALGLKQTTHTARIVPIYHTTEKLSQKQLRYLMSLIIQHAAEVKEWLPEEFLEAADLVPLPEAIRGIHFPEDEVDLAQAQKRIKFGEIFLMQLRAEMVKQALKRSSAPVINFQEEAIKDLVAVLPFKLTQAQRVAAWEILQDLQKSEPMNRLLEGDVGSGKTVVAAMALYNTVLNGFQAIIMAPTEILARQHFESFKKLLGDKINIALFTRSQCQISNFQFLMKTSKSNKQKVIDNIQNGKVQIVIGTHALLSDNLEFKNLGLVIVDEQHRFGVEQRKKLKEKTDHNLVPHFLSMTATPIPRSFALLLYGDLDLSIINELPVGRLPIKTKLVAPEKREQAYKFIAEQIKQGRQAFVICPLIESDLDDKKTVMSEYEKLSQTVFPSLKVGFLHGKLKAKEKAETMAQFTNGTINILVSTSVVEVGVNIPNASVMMIEGAERFGLAQLHQFRGRVGRAEHQSYCFLFSDTENEEALTRLNFFEKNADGFKVAEYDLEMRGPGEVYGTAQSGMTDFKMASLKDIKLIKLARDLARGIDFNKYPILKEKVKEWERGVHLE